jgi:PKD repeat protein
LDHAGASWEWAFEPTPFYVSSFTDRNPKVVFDTEGSYNVSLTVTDGNGNTSTKTVEDMVQVFNFCQADTIPGKALECQVDGDFAETGNFDLNTNEFSFTAWIKPNGIQNAYTGILMNNNTAAGLNFRDNNELGYHWSGGQWWWNSGLIAPEGEWSHVALVATAGSVTIYLNGVSSTHNTAIESVNINTMLMGSYQGWGGRNRKFNRDRFRHNSLLPI